MSMVCVLFEFQSSFKSTLTSVSSKVEMLHLLLSNFKLFSFYIRKVRYGLYLCKELQTQSSWQRRVVCFHGG